MPEPLGLGEPGEGYPGPWTAYRWIPGEPIHPGRFGDLDAFARDLAGVVTALHAIDTGGRAWSGSGRGGPLAAEDGGVRSAPGQQRPLTDTARLAEVWDRCRDASREYQVPTCGSHADLMPGNLLVRDGRLAAVIDLGAVGVGDPAVDLMPAWNLFDAGPGRRTGGRSAWTTRRGSGGADGRWSRRSTRCRTTSRPTG